MVHCCCYIYSGFDARNGLQCPSSDEECSRSSTVRSKAKQCTLGVGSALNGRSRKRKKKKKKAPLSSSVLTLPVSGVSPRPVCTVVKDFEDPLPQRRNDLLRGGATCLQQVSPEFDTLLAHSNTGISANLKLTVPPVTSIKLSDTSCTKDEEKSCVKQINEPPPACGSPPEKGRQRSTNRRRRQLRRMSVHRGQPLLWSRLSRSHMQRRQLYVSSMSEIMEVCTWLSQGIIHVCKFQLSSVG